MQYCELCGEKIGGLSAYSCKIIPNQQRDATLCKHCASCFNARLISDEKEVIRFINWSDNLLKKNILNEPYRTQMLLYNKEAKEKITPPSDNNSQSNTPHQESLDHAPIDDYYPISVYSNKSSTNTWIKVTKIMGYLGIIGAVIIGIVLGNIIGGIVGLIIGICVFSFNMMIASLCEDVVEVKNLLRQKNE